MTRVLVTGGSRGIGRAIVERFAGAGAAVVFCYSSGADAARAVERSYDSVSSEQIDLRGRDAPAELVAAACSRLGGLDVVVNSAGIYPHAPFEETPAAAVEEVFRVNVFAPFGVMRAAVAHMPAGSAIVNVTSINAFSPDAGLSAYDASKAALAQATRAAALELGRRGIRVNAVAPGLVDDPGLEDAAPERRRAFLAHAPLGRLVQPEDVAEAVWFLASPAAAAITGQTVVVDAGVTLAGYTAG